MSNKFSRWLRSKRGTQIIVGIVAMLCVVVIVGAVAGWWADIIDLLSGTVAPPPPEFAPPDGGVTCLPSCDETDGKFFSMPGEDMQSFGGAATVIWISVPSQYASFQLAFFDGDSGKGATEGEPMWTGNWDNTTTRTSYSVYADPLKDGPPRDQDGNPLPETAVWSATSDDMLNNDWYEVTIDNVSEAQGASGHYFYRLEVTRPVEGWGINAFKVRSDAYLSTGQAGMVDASFAIVGMLATMPDAYIVYPEFAMNFNNPGPSTYSGVWDLYFYVPPAEYPTRTVSIEIWDGDFDRGTRPQVAADTDDANTEGVPPWGGDFAQPEGVGGTYRGMPGMGSPADDYPAGIYRRNPPVEYTITNPAGDPIYVNDEPSGTEEWERFVISTESTGDPDEVTAELQPGWYGLRIQGLDMHNTVWLRVNSEVVTQPPPPECDASCPRTIGYWKNNVKKVLIDGKTKGVQESEESIEKALSLVAQYSPLFRQGIDVQNPQPIDTIAPLTAEEANMILQRKQNDYPGGKDQANSMLARALQQNLAAWLNWGSGKICTDTVVTLDATGGPFEGILWKALQEAQDIVLNGGDLERAKDIGDLINNGLLGEDAPENTTCDVDDYEDTVPPDLQPPKDKPKAPKPPTPPQPVIECTDVRTNQYNTEVSDNPFAGVKFEYTSGTEVKNGDYDEFQVILTPEQAAALTSVQLEAKAGENVGLATLEGCQFDQLAAGETCAPVQDENGFFTFTFAGAMPNEDGSQITLPFWVQNHTEYGLSHATVGVPDGEVPSSYESEVCLD